ncbi:uncharacterized protein [Elaeis guineensis]|uniref:uncharacterized protein isoform X3 n=1 Tax=Elaeis guineensis var. tenera TaxID=51953 RepID=UPI003C6D1D50
MKRLIHIPINLTEQRTIMSGDAGVSAFPEGENIFSWVGTIEGSKGTPYEGLSYELSLHFPFDYPFKPPQVKFETPCFHPNVDHCGNICLDILQDMWSSAYDCRTILLSIQSLLGEPNNESPLNSYAATLWSNQEGVIFYLYYFPHLFYASSSVTLFFIQANCTGGVLLCLVWEKLLWDTNDFFFLSTLPLFGYLLELIQFLLEGGSHCDPRLPFIG